MIDRTDQGPVLGAGYFHLFATAIAVFGIVLCFMWANGKSLRPYGFIALAVGLIPWAITAFRFYQLRKKIGKASLDLDDPIPLGFCDLYASAARCRIGFRGSPAAVRRGICARKR